MAELVPNGPLPSTLTLLSGLKSFSPGQKVRFLGCVATYSLKTASLVLEHNYPPENGLTAIVDIRLLLTTLKPGQTQVGEWMNVIGYIEKEQPKRRANAEPSSVRVQALALWSTGPLKLQAYERSLDQQKPEKDTT